MTAPANLLAEWSALLLDGLAAAGVTDVVVSPGSRSTPLVLAAHAHPRLRLWDAIDERAAAFFALGQARVSGRPSLLLCTSGSAGAHYLPAVIEADAAYLPLLVLTADRPLELQACAAPQTIDQIKLYGDKVRRSFELGVPDESEGALRGLRRIAAQAVLAAQWPTPGPVHLNARARKPLEPQPPVTPDEHALAARAARLRAEPVALAPPPRTVPGADAIRAAAGLVSRHARGLIVCGPAPVAQAALRADVQALAARTGFVICAEAPSQLRFAPQPDGPAVRCDAFDALLRDTGFRARADVDCVVQIGAPPTSRGLELLFSRMDLPRVVVAAHGWNDPHASAQQLLLGDVAASLQALIDALPPRPPAQSAWQALWARADAVAAGLIDSQLADERSLSEAAAVRQVVRRLPAGSLLMVGNSLPVRAVDLWCAGGLADVRVLSQRGANGIDGLVAGAAGAAGSAGLPLTLLVGDVSFLHDLNGLWLARQIGTPLVLVVVNNQGGRIFEQLPIAKTADAGVLARFTTPHALSFGPAAQLFGLPYAHATTGAALDAALDAAYAHPGCTLVEVAVPPASAAAAQARFLDALAPALRPI